MGAGTVSRIRLPVMDPAPAAALAVQARGLVKRFGERVAVNAIDLDIPAGRCFGVLGPNGAGKTTTIRMITCVSPPTAGSLRVLGIDVLGDRRSIKARIGVVAQGMTLDTELLVRENLVTFGLYHQLPLATAHRRADELLEFASLTDRARAKVNDLSGGMQRRLLIARALVNDPDLVVLDEPTTGLDPQARHFVWERLRSLKRLGKTLIVTTHYMDEAAQLCDELIVVDDGRIIAAGTPAELIRGTVASRVVEVHGNPSLSALRALLASVTSDVERVGDRVLVYSDESDIVASRIRDANVAHSALLMRDTTLEDVFLRLTGRALVEA
jgi:lipooligosaccharide transport system ATP-binding protein